MQYEATPLWWTRAALLGVATPLWWTRAANDEQDGIRRN
jgi:hypothetical protein